MSEPAAAYPTESTPGAPPVGRPRPGPPVGSVPPPPPPGVPGQPPEERSRYRGTIEWIVIIGAALVVALVVKTFLFQAFYIPSGSMEPTLKPGDRVLVNKLSYRMHPIHRGDIVVFKRPPSEAEDPAIKDLIKRVIGLPGDTIEAREGLVYINGNLVSEPYLPRGTLTTILPSQTVKAGQYFVMGDNRNNSKDSRFIGAIGSNLIVGRAFVRVWPISGLRLF